MSSNEARLREREKAIITALENATGAPIPDGGHYLNDILQRIATLRVERDSAKAQFLAAETRHAEFLDTIEPMLQDIHTGIDNVRDSVE